MSNVKDELKEIRETLTAIYMGEKDEEDLSPMEMQYVREAEKYLARIES